MRRRRVSSWWLSSSSRDIALGVFICLLSLTCYWSSLGGDFVHDDVVAVCGNPDVLGKTSLTEVFLNDFWGKPMADQRSHKSYRPLTVITFRAQAWFWGLDAWSFHLANVCLHLVSCLLILCLCRSVLRMDREVSGAAASLFAAHPVHTEADLKIYNFAVGTFVIQWLFSLIFVVSGIVGRAEVLSGVLFFSGLLLFCRRPRRPHLHATLHNKCSHQSGRTPSPPHHHHQQQHPAQQHWAALRWDEDGEEVKGDWWIGSACCTAFAFFALLAKEQGLTVLAVAAIYSLLNNNNRSWRLRELLFLSLSLVVLFSLRLWMLYGSLPLFSDQDNPAACSSKWLTRFLTFSYLCVFNGWLLLYPWRLSYDWQMGSVPLVHSVWDVRNLATVAFFVSLLTLVLTVARTPAHKVKDRRVLTLSLATLAFPFLPASNIFFSVGFVIAERVLYIPSAGFCLLVSFGLERLREQGWRVAWICRLSLGCLLACSVLRTIKRNGDWATRETLFLSGLQTVPENAKVHYNYANLQKDLGNLELAEKHYRQALKLWPDHASAHNNLGTVLADGEEAETHFRKALDIHPQHARAHFNLAALYSKQGQAEVAMNLLHRAVDLEPDFAEAYSSLAVLYADRGQFRRAEEYHKRALELDEDSADSLNNYGAFLQKMGRIPEAVSQYQRAIRLQPNHTVALVNAARTLKALKSSTEAEALYQRALSIEEDPQILDNLGVLYLSGGRIRDAKRVYTRLLDKEPNHLDAKARYAQVLLAERSWEAAEQLLLSVTERNSSHREALHQLAVLYTHQNKTTEALDYMLRALSLCRGTDPDCGQLHTEHGDILRDLGALHDAAQSYQAAIQLDSSIAHAHLNLAVIRHLQGQYAEALVHYQDASQLDPDNDLIRENLDKLQRTLVRRTSNNLCQAPASGCRRW